MRDPVTVISESVPPVGAFASSSATGPAACASKGPAAVASPAGCFVGSAAASETLAGAAASFAATRIGFFGFSVSA